MRVQLRIDEYKNWYDKNPRLLPGEIAISYEVYDTKVIVDEVETVQKSVHNIKIKAGAFKVGQGAKELYNYRELPFINSTIDMSTFDAGILSANQISALAQTLSADIPKYIDISSLNEKIVQNMSDTQISTMIDTMIGGISDSQKEQLKQDLGISKVTIRTWFSGEEG